MHYHERSCARQKLDKTDTERCLGIDELGRLVWQMVAPELKLTKNQERAGLPLPRIVVERALEVQSRRFNVLSADIEAHGHSGGCPGCAALASHVEERQNHIMTNAENESERSSREL